MTKAFLIDIDKCCGCHNCQVACKDEYCSQPWLPYSDAQPETGSFWCRVDEKERGQAPVVTVTYTPTMCAHCADAPCAAVCPAGAFATREDGLVLLDSAKCTGCGACIEACPIGAIYANGEKKISQKCTGCAHLLDDGWTVPRCVDVCALDALQFGEETELDLDGAECLPGLEGCGARVWYKNLPKRFAAGCVYDPVVNDVIIGAKVTLAGADGAVVATQLTDEFGDWKFNQIAPAAYHVTVEAEGYQALELDVDVTDIDRFTGDRPMARA